MRGEPGWHHIFVASQVTALKWTSENETRVESDWKDEIKGKQKIKLMQSM